MKFPGEAAERIARCLLSSGPATVAELGDRLTMSSAALRRPLHALLDSGLVSAEDRRPYGPEPKKGRGRPSKVFALTEAGRRACDGGGGDDLAIAALRYLAELGGRDAIIDFAKERALALVGTEPTTPEQVAARLTNAGYAASIERSSVGGLQLCQHHCPAVDAAREFPELCEAESIVLSEVLGRSVTRLATLQHGDAVCTAALGAPNRTQSDSELKELSHHEQGRVPA
jgi:predicted ArsR family transcriptional regulator